jgi:dTDP-glucose 4,6-dehydratase
MKRVIVTGGFGFVGLHIVQKLLQKNYHVIAVDIDDFFNRRQFLETAGSFEIIQQNLADKNAAHHLPNDVDYIIHLAALPHVDYSCYYENETINNNIYSMKTILEHAKNTHAKVLFTSSVEVYGGNNDKIYCETDCTAPQSIYGYSKLMCEQLANYYIDKHGIDCTILRLTNLYGSAQLPDRIIPRNICRLVDHMQFDLTSNFYRDFLYIEDAADAIIKMMIHGKCGEIYNLSSGTSYDMAYVASKLIQIFGISDIYSFNSQTVNQARGRHLKIDCHKISAFVDPPKFNLDDGLQKTVVWYKQNQFWSMQFEAQYSSLRDGAEFIIDKFHIHSLLRDYGNENYPPIVKSKQIRYSQLTGKEVMI